MPTITYTATGRRHDGVIDLRVEFAGGAVLTRTVTASKINTPEKLATWLLEQQPDGDGAEVSELRRAFTVTFHVAADGARVIDEVQAAEHPDDGAWAALAGSQLGRVTLAEALAAVDNAATLVQLKAVVRAVVQVVIPLRDVMERILTGLRRAGLR